MLDQFLSRIFSSWLVFAILAVVLLALSEFGWRVGLARSQLKPGQMKDGGSVPAAVLTLLGLLLGFTFAMAVSRHDTRRELVVQEANSILTTARRAQLLPQPQATNVGRLLREYVALRIEAHRETQFSQRFAALRKSSVDLHERLWNEAVAAPAKQTSPITASFIASLNETIEFGGDAHRCQAQSRAWRRLAAVVVCRRLWSVADRLGGGNRPRSPSSCAISVSTSYRHRPCADY